MIYFSDFSVPSSAIAGALVTHSSNESVANGAAKGFNSETYDGDNYHDLVTSNSRLTIPSGVSLARVITNTFIPSAVFSLILNKNGASFAGTNQYSTNIIGGVPANLASAIVSVSAADYFTVVNDSGSSTTINADELWFAIEPIDSAQKYALVNKSATQAISAATTTTVTFGAEVADTDAFHDNVTNNSRLTVPSGVTRVRLSGCCANGGTSSQFVVTMLKNGASARGLPAKDTETTSATTLGFVSAIMAVSTSDYFEMRYFSAAATTLQNNDRTWFQIEEVDASIKYALVYKSGTQAISANTWTVVAFGAEEADADGMHDNSTNNSRLTVPSGCTRARATFGLKTPSSANRSRARVIKNGTSAYAAGLPAQLSDTAGTDSINGMGAWVSVSPGDYFELEYFVDGGLTLGTDDETWFQLECA